MSPDHTSYDFTDNTWVDAVFACKFCLLDTTGGISLSNLNDFLARQLCRVLLYAFVLATFCYHILAILKTSAKEQVGRIHAYAVITAMTDIKPVRNWPVVQFIRNSMRIRHLSGDVCLQLSITACAFYGSPVPATVRLLNFGPKSLFNGLNYNTVAYAASGVTCLTTEPDTASGEPGWRDSERLFTVLASDGNTFWSFIRGCVSMGMHMECPFRVPRLW